MNQAHPVRVAGVTIGNIAGSPFAGVGFQSRSKTLDVGVKLGLWMANRFFKGEQKTVFFYPTLSNADCRSRAGPFVASNKYFGAYYSTCTPRVSNKSAAFRQKRCHDAINFKSLEETAYDALKDQIQIYWPNATTDDIASVRAKIDSVKLACPGGFLRYIESNSSKHRALGEIIQEADSYTQQAERLGIPTKIINYYKSLKENNGDLSFSEADCYIYLQNKLLLTFDYYKW